MATGAAPTGSDRAALSIEPKMQEKPLESGGFSLFTVRAAGRENPLGLLDIGESLC